MRYGARPSCGALFFTCGIPSPSAFASLNCRLLRGFPSGERPKSSCTFDDQPQMSLLRLRSIERVAPAATETKNHHIIHGVRAKLKLYGSVHVYEMNDI